MNAVETSSSHGKRSRLFKTAAALLTSASVLSPAVSQTHPPTPAAPNSLEETGLFLDAASLQVDKRLLEYSPQYPLWTDGARKRRWVSIPAGRAIDASDPEAWTFPVGTRFWKEFSFDGKRVETRYMQLQPNGEWLFATYAWSADGQKAELVSPRGKRNAYRLNEEASHSIPSVADCKACHQGGRGEVLGFSALQLSPERDVQALHAEPKPAPGVDLHYLVQHAYLVGLPEELLRRPPSIAALTPNERIVLGYLHGNCAHCHNQFGPLQNLNLFLRKLISGTRPEALVSLREPARKRAPGQTEDALLRVAPGDPARSVLAQRVASRYPPLQMPPLGTELVDDEAVSALRRWIAELDTTNSSEESRP